MSPRPRSPAKLAALVAAVVVLLGAAIAAIPSGQAPAEPPPEPPVVAVDQLFRQGIDFLKRGRAHEAAVVFEAAARQRPDLPEVAVNLGFARLALGEHQAARQAFERALELRPEQTNAYWGLALALEGQGDLEAAVGAMRTFNHLEPAESAFRRKASAALWEWEDKLRLQRAGQEFKPAPGSVDVRGQPVTSPEQMRREEAK